jgi:hypothetical protein
MSARRAFAGAVALAALAAAATAYTNSCPILGTLFVVVGLLGLILTCAKWIPVLHKLPLVGAIPPPKVTFALAAPLDGMTFPMNPTAEARVLLSVVIPEGRPHEITRGVVNVYVVDALNIYRTDADGQPYEDGGRRGKGPDGPYWSIHPHTIPLGAQVMYFKVTIPEPGEYEVVFKLQSPDLYSKKDYVYRGKLIARSREVREEER